MSDRRLETRSFLSGTVAHGWTLQPIAADASSRTYTRLTGPGGDRAILMDAGPNPGADFDAFTTIAAFLTDNHLAAPSILSRDREAGFLLLTDLGTDTVADVLTVDPSVEPDLYDAATDILVALDQLNPPDLPHMTPLVGAQMVGITAKLYAKTDPKPLMQAVHDTLTAFAPDPDRLALRDVHAENLIWRRDHIGLDRIGLLDFQDAFIAPRGYDLASLLSDVRRPVSLATRERQTMRFARATDTDPAAMARTLATLGAQRNLRILGVFTRLIQSGKPQYKAMMHRVWTTLQTDLSHPDLSTLRRVVVRDLPAVSE